MWEFWSLLQLVGSFCCCCSIMDSAAACGIKFPDQGANLDPLHWECRVLATEPLGESRQEALEVVCSVSFVALPLVPNWEGLSKRKHGRSQDGGGIGQGDHFLSYKFIKRINERRANFTKQLLISSWGHQAPRKATHCLRKECCMVEEVLRLLEE